MSNVESGGWKEFLRIFSISRQELIITYRWSILATLQQKRPPRPVDAAPWWKFLFFAATALSLSLAVGVICTVQMNPLSIGSLGYVTSALQLISEIGKSADRINDDLIARRPGSDSFVMAGAIASWFLLASVIAIISAVRAGGRRFGRVKFEEYCYVVAIITFNYAIAWFAISLAAILVQAVSHPFLSPSTRSDTAGWLFVACNMIAAVGVFVWLQWRKAGGFRRWKSPARLTVWTILCLIGMSGVLIHIGSIVGEKFKSNLRFEVSFRCDSSECYVYAQSVNSTRMILDGSAKLWVTLKYLGKNPSDTKQILGHAEILFSQPQSNSGPAILEPGAEQILKVRKIVLTCEQEVPTDGAFLPVSATGSIPVHIPNRKSGESRAVVPVVVSENLVNLFRSADGGCPVRL